MTGNRELGRCPACSSSARSAQGIAEDLRLFECADCGLVYSDPQPRGRVARKYLEQYDLADHFGGLASRKTVLYERRLAWLPPASPGRDALLDVGCGDGQFLEIAALRGWRPFGVELNPPAAERARSRGATIVEGVFEDIENLPLDCFDLVTSWDSLEHTPEPLRFARALTTVLRPGGHLALTTLNRRSLAARVFGLRWSMVGEDHFTYWDSRSLSRLFGNLGMEITRTEHFGLGRDFVRWLGGAERRREDTAAAAGGRATPSEWDSARVTLAAERVVNRLLDASALGVGVAMLLRRAAPSGL